MNMFFNHHQELLFIFLFVSGILSGLVDSIAGGGGLVSIPALTLTGMPLPVVMGTNKLQSSIGTSTSSYQYYKAGYINLRTATNGLISGFFGAMLGVILVHHISSDFLNYLTPSLMVLVLIFNMLNRSFGVVKSQQRMNETLFFLIFGFILGFYDAFFGPGVGNFWVMAISYFLGYTYLEASGYSKLLNLKSNVFSLVLFLYFGQVNFTYGLIMAIGNSLGAKTGSKIAVSKGSTLIRPVLICVIVISISLATYQLILQKI